jgi:hypothetical protein
MSAPKLIDVIGLLLNVESTYGTAGAALTVGTHGVLLQDEAEAEITYINDGARDTNTGLGGPTRGVRPSGRQVSIPFKVEARGAGAAYSASVKPPDAHNLFLMSGHTATLDTTAGAQKYTYKPATNALGANYTSCYGELYARAQKYTFTGAYADFGYSFEAGGILVLEFPTVGLVSLPVDGTLGVIPWTGADPPKAENSAWAIGSWTSAVIRKASFKAGRTQSPRTDAGGSSGAHRGFSQGGKRTSLLELTVEAVPLATFDPYTARDNATSLNVTGTFGSTLYSRVAPRHPQAQIIEVKEDKDGNTALWNLTLKCAKSAPHADDDYEIAYT